MVLVITLYPPSMWLEDGVGRRPTYDNRFRGRLFRMLGDVTIGEEVE
jgi:hypothetical protein